MRHRRHSSKLNRTVEHRTALMRNLAIALIDNGIIKTTEPKAKQLRQYIERIITIAKDGLAANDDAGIGLAKRRLAFSYLNNKEAVKKLFAEVAPASAQRAGGYTRVVKAGPRAGDGAPMAYIEFVDREVAASEAPAAEEKAKKPRRRTKKPAGETAAA
ncbi:MAG: 50S ribosomal protein L17 [Candidatus Sumerlaeaceae bacterium]